ncbi:putative plastid-lipid-associated protein 13 chloroplastic [Bienertia sinuspersici]
MTRCGSLFAPVSLTSSPFSVGKLKDAGGFEGLVTGKVTEMHRIDVMERVTALERLNPSPRPTTSPYLEGRWNFDWLGSGTPAAAQFVLRMYYEIPSAIGKPLKNGCVAEG